MFGLWVGAFCHVIFAVAGLTAILAASALAFSIVKWVGVVLAYSEEILRKDGFSPSVEKAMALLCRPDLDGFWLHLDVDVLSHEALPAADFPLAGGLQWNELEPILVAALDTRKVVGIDVTPVFHPAGARVLS